jgi:N-acetylglucosaminyldiphosphoundecaprenol N-acetyl-beta-D-mannosaminyltransferase
MIKQIISLTISISSYSSIRDKIISLVLKRRSSYICVANVHMTIEAYWDKEFATSVNNADLVTPDGMPIAMALRLLYGLKQERVAGMDLLPDLLKEAEERNLSVFFYGGTQEMLDKTNRFIQEHYPSLEKHNYLSPPFRPLSNEEEESVIKQINDTGANIVFVALGCPKQEKWMASMKGRINSCMIGIGGALPVMIGDQKRAPYWMQKASLEWFYRLIQEPRRLFKRYLVTNTLFIFLIIKQLYSNRLKK